MLDLAALIWIVLVVGDVVYVDWREPIVRHQTSWWTVGTLRLVSVRVVARKMRWTAISIQQVIQVKCWRFLQYAILISCLRGTSCRYFECFFLLFIFFIYLLLIVDWLEQFVIIFLSGFFDFWWLPLVRAVFRCFLNTAHSILNLYLFDKRPTHTSFAHICLLGKCTRNCIWAALRFPEFVKTLHLLLGLILDGLLPCLGDCLLQLSLCIFIVRDQKKKLIWMLLTYGSSYWGITVFDSKFLTHYRSNYFYLSLKKNIINWNIIIKIKH